MRHLNVAEYHCMIGLSKLYSCGKSYVISQHPGVPYMWIPLDTYQWVQFQQWQAIQMQLYVHQDHQIMTKEVGVQTHSTINNTLRERDI